jgi:mannose-6-phosphate isomerase
MFTPPGVLHAYLKGFGVEIMASSDNVLRGGLTSKHVDASALIDVVDFEPKEAKVSFPSQESTGVWRFDDDAFDFDLRKVEIDQETISLPAPGTPRILICLNGELLSTAEGTQNWISQGEAVFFGADEHSTISGTGTGFLASVG